MTSLSRTGNLAERVEALTALAATPAAEVYLDPAEVDYEAWNHVGDPLCEALMGLMRERKLMGGDIYANARALEAEGLPEAVAFFADVETLPSWFDIDAMRLGASMAKRNPVGLLFGIHSALPFTYIDGSTAEVMGATGRLAQEGDFSRRFWETAGGFLGTIDVDGMLPGGDRWIQWVRIRFLHTMIRLGIHRGGRWSRYDTATPISQMGTAAATHIFGQHRVNQIEYFGGIVTQEERDGFALTWRWVARIEGANNQLLGRTHAEEFELSLREHRFLYGPTEKAQKLIADVVDGTTSMKEFGGSRRFNHAIVRQLMSPTMLDTLRTYDVQADFGLNADPATERALRAATVALRGVNQLTRLKSVRKYFDVHGQRILDSAVERGLQGHKAEYRGTAVAGRPTDR